jgi:hypothetical protein
MTTAVRDGRRVTYRPRMNKQDREMTAARLRQEYEAGNSVRGVANGNGLSYGTTYRLLLAAGAKLRDRTGRPTTTTTKEGA